MERLCPDLKKRFPDGQQQQAISIYFFLEGLGFRVLVTHLSGIMGELKVNLFHNTRNI